MTNVLKFKPDNDNQKAIMTEEEYLFSITQTLGGLFVDGGVKPADAVSAMMLSIANVVKNHKNVTNQQAVDCFREILSAVNKGEP